MYAIAVEMSDTQTVCPPNASVYYDDNQVTTIQCRAAEHAEHLVKKVLEEAENVENAMRKVFTDAWNVSPL